MKDLIHELKQATEGSRELDWNIHKFLNIVTDMGEYRTTMVGVWLPHYTTSLDAALTLVPEGWEWELEWEHSTVAETEIARCKMGDPLLFIDPEAATPALALCIAALKAREQADG